MKTIRNGNGKIVGYVEDLEKDYGIKNGGKHILDTDGRIVGYEDNLDSWLREPKSASGQHSTRESLSDGFGGPPCPYEEPNTPSFLATYILSLVIIAPIVYLFEYLFNTLLCNRYNEMIYGFVLAVLILLYIGILIGIWKIRKYIYKTKMAKYEALRDEWYR